MHFRVPYPQKALGGGNYGMKSREITVTKMAGMLSRCKMGCPGFSRTLVGNSIVYALYEEVLSHKAMKNQLPDLAVNDFLQKSHSQVCVYNYMNTADFNRLGYI